MCTGDLWGKLTEGTGQASELCSRRLTSTPAPSLGMGITPLLGLGEGMPSQGTVWGAAQEVRLGDRFAKVSWWSAQHPLQQHPEAAETGSFPGGQRVEGTGMSHRLLLVSLAKSHSTEVMAALDPPSVPSPPLLPADITIYSHPPVSQAHGLHKVHPIDLTPQLFRQRALGSGSPSLPALGPGTSDPPSRICLPSWLKWR